MDQKEKVVLAYSGGLDTSVIIRWLVDTYACEVIAVCANLGQEEELDGLEEKALQSGASCFFIEDLREEFIQDYIYPTLKAGAVYEGKYLLGTSFARPLIAKRLVEIAQREGATMVSHGATGKGNDQVRFELAFMALDPTLKIIAPWKEEKWNLRSREDCIAYAEEHGIPVSQSKERMYSEDRNIWHISHEGGDLEDPTQEPQDAVYTLTNILEKAPHEAGYLEIGFEKGEPVSLDGEMQDPVTLLKMLNKLGGEHAVGHVDMVENRLVGMKSRGVYENPGGALLYYAHRELEELVLDRDTRQFKERLALHYAELVYDGKWFSPLREAMDAFVEKTQEKVTGTVRLKLYKGNIISAGKQSPHSLYQKDLASFADSEMYDQKDAKGFIKIFGLPLKLQGYQKKG